MDSKKIAALRMRQPKWAQLNKEEKKGDEEKNDKRNLLDENEDDDALSVLYQMTRSTGKYICLARKNKILSKDESTAKHLKDITVGHNSNGSVNCVKFHPSRPVLVTGANNGTVSLFEICENADKLIVKKNDNFLQDAKFKRCSIDTVYFFNDGLSLFVVPTNKKYCFSYDMMEGKVSQVTLPESLLSTRLRISKTTLSSDGMFVAYLIGNTDIYVFLFSTIEHLHTFRSDTIIKDFFFSTSNRNIIYAFTEIGTVYLWDLAQRLAQFRFTDEGCVQATCLAISPNEQFIACGSNTGIVNVYEASKAWNISSDDAAKTVNELKPLYTLGNLTTSASFLKFNHDSQLLTFGSDVKSIAVRLLHCRSGNVYQNFPSRPEMFSRDRIKCGSFSPNSAFLAYGSESGECRLYRINHFDRY